jgi:putative flavoprotein involved in K+ transport
MRTERYDTIVIGAGQAGLVTGYHLQRASRSFLILDGNARVGDNWRERYDSLRLFTPAYGCSLDGFPFPSEHSTCPTKDGFADYLEAYVARFNLPVRTGVQVDGVRREGDRYLVSAGDTTFEASNVVVASGASRDPRVPVFADQLDRSIVQMHSSAYRNPSQLQDGHVLIVGVGNSGADVALEVSRTHATSISGTPSGHVPVDIDSWPARNIGFHVIRFFGLHVFTLRNPLGRRAYRKMASGGGAHPLVRVKPKWLERAGVEIVPRTVGIQDGKPVLEDGRVLDDVRNVVWCVGFRHDLSWIDLPIFGEDGAPVHERGVVTSEPGLYFMGLPFQFSSGSDVIPGVGRDARWIVKQLVRRSRMREADRATAPLAAA